MAQKTRIANISHVLCRMCKGRFGLVIAAAALIVLGPLPLSANVVSDDFSSEELSSSVWDFVNPTGEASISTNAEQLVISIPGSSSDHDFWNGSNTLPRVMQPVPDGDFKVEAKFESGLPASITGQGIFVEQNATSGIRFEFHNVSGETRVFAATIDGGSPSVQLSQAVALGGVSYLRVERSGDQWTLWYSLDGTTWSLAGSFMYEMAVHSAGVYSLSLGPEISTAVDYFFDAGAPIVPEDCCLDVSVSGSGSVLMNPEQPAYSPGDNVELTAVPDAGWEFEGWTGSVTDAQNPLSVTVEEGRKFLTASFIPAADVTSPLITQLTVSSTADTALLEWSTDEAATSRVEYGLDSSYGTSVEDATLEVTHALLLTGLQPGTTYHYQVSSTDAAGNETSTTDATFATSALSLKGSILPNGFVQQEYSVQLETLNGVGGLTWQVVGGALPAGLSMDGSTGMIEGIPAEKGLFNFTVSVEDEASQSAEADFSIEVKRAAISDDFSSGSLDLSLWNFVNPTGEAVLSKTETQAQIGIPEGSSDHDFWSGPNTLPRLMQAVPDEDFGVEVKFESALVASISGQGIFVEQDAGNGLRFEFHNVNGQTKIFAASVFGGSGVVHASQSVPATSVMYLRVAREGQQWSLWRSRDGITWEGVTSFAKEMTVSAVGVYALSVGANHTATVDYFFNTAAPIEPEDCCLVLSVVGAGAVQKNPDKPKYEAGEQVELTAIPEADWTFEGWDGDASGSQNPITVVAPASGASVVANFVDVTAPKISGLQVVESGTTAVITWMTDEPATSLVEFGETESYGNSVSDSSLKTSHALDLSGLLPTSLYHFRASSTDEAGNHTSSDDSTFTTSGLTIQSNDLPDGGYLEPYASSLTATGGVGELDWTVVEGTLPAGLSLDGSTGVVSGIPQALGSWQLGIRVTDSLSQVSESDVTITIHPAIVSDDFSAPDLNTSLWTFVNPTGQAAASVTGTQVEIAIPPGASEHDFWSGPNTLPRLMQPAPDRDFEVEVKFESPVSESITGQGIFVEEGADSGIRFEFHNFGGQTKIFAAHLQAGSAVQLVNESVTVGDLMFLRVARAGDNWTIWHSQDGETWTGAGSFSRQVAVSAVGVYALSIDAAHAARVDYFFNGAAPIAPEDCCLTVTVVGEGLVTKNPVQPGYSPGDVVTLTGTAEPGWEFLEWAGDLTGSENPVSVTVAEQGTDILATFVDVTPPAISNVAVDSLAGVVSWSTDEQASSRVDYGLTDSYGAVVTDATPKQTHSLALSDLQPDTEYHYKITSADAAGNSASTGDASFTTPGLTISTTQLPSGAISVPYSAQLTAVQAVGAATWSVISGTLPEGVNLHASTGQLSGTPEAVGQSDFRVRVADSAGQVDERDLSVEITLVPPGPIITLWYGDQQRFGHLGNPQRWVNLLGSVSDPDGVAWLTYSLNGAEPRPLAMGPDARRLLRQGDFNIEIDRTNLLYGINEIDIRAADTLGNESVKSVAVDYRSDNVWQSNFSIEWTAVSDIQDVVQVVDGKWGLSPEGLRTVEVGYDRTFAVGDETWEDYELTIPITVHDIDESAYGTVSLYPALGFGLRWKGHTKFSVEEPSLNWLPQGGTPWYEYETTEGRLRLFGQVNFKQGLFEEAAGAPVLEPGATYIWQARAESLPDGQTFYGVKVFQQGSGEPAGWDLSGVDGPQDLQSGSVIFVAHHVDATFGDLTVVPLAEDAEGPNISDIRVTDLGSSAIVEWRSDEPGSGRVRHGATGAYELGSVESHGPVTDHSVTLRNLTADQTYHYAIESGDERGNWTVLPDATLMLNSVNTPSPSGLVADEFAGDELDAEIWTFVNPLGDVQYSVDGGELYLTLPSTAGHDFWAGENNLPRAVQSVNDPKVFEVRTNFNSVVDETFQSQGILVGEDILNGIRFEVHHLNGQVRLFVAGVTDGSSVVHERRQIFLGTPGFLRVRRLEDEWTFWYSYDGLSWTLGARFDHSINVSSVGVHAGNDEGTAHAVAIESFAVDLPGTSP